jgi:hypothetical protein
MSGREGAGIGTAVAVLVLALTLDVELWLLGIVVAPILLLGLAVGELVRNWSSR